MITFLNFSWTQQEYERIIINLFYLCVTQAAIYPGNVLSIYMKKPPSFKYKSGMYLFVKCPDVSPFEWYKCSVVIIQGMTLLKLSPKICQIMQASLLHHFSAWRWLLERSYPYIRWLDVRTQEPVWEGILAEQRWNAGLFLSGIMKLFSIICQVCGIVTWICYMNTRFHAGLWSRSNF